MVDEAAPAAAKQLEPYQFKPGQSGNPKGRAKGSRNKLGEAFVAALHEDFLEHGPGVIADVRVNKPDAYLRVIASILPKEIKIESVNELSDDELDKRIRQLAAALSLEIGIGGSAGREEAADGSVQVIDVQALQ